MPKKDLLGPEILKPNISEEAMQQLHRVYTSLKQDRERYDLRWQEIARFINPAYGNWDETHPQDSRTDPFDYKDIFDNTAMKASSLLADGIQGYAFGRNTSWFRLAFEDEKLMQTRAYSEWLQAVERHFYKQLNRSNFYDEGRAFIKCGADFGTAVMFRMEDTVRGMPSYKTLHLKNCMIQENQFGEVDTLFREFWLNPDNAAGYFGEDKLPRIIQDARKGSPTKEFRFVQYVGPRGQYDADVPGTDPFVSVYWADCEATKAISTGQYDSKPFFSWRWSRSMNGDVWGADCPGMIELPNVRQAQSMRKDFNRMVQLSARPPIKATEGLRGRINLTPNGMTYIRPGEDFAPTAMIGNVQGIAEDLAELRKSTNESYHTDFFLILTQNIERTKTATEVAGLQGEKAALLSAFFGRLSSEFLEPILEDLFSLEAQTLRLPPTPQGLVGLDLKIDFISPLAMTQKRVHEMQATDEAVSRIFQIAQYDQTALDTIDLDEYVKTVSEAYNMKQTVLRDEMDVRRIRLARAKQQQQLMQAQMQMEQAKAGAEVAAKTSKAPEEGSPMAAQMGGR